MNWIKNIHSGMFVCVSRRVGVHMHMVVQYKKILNLQSGPTHALTHTRTHAHTHTRTWYVSFGIHTPLLYILELYFGI